MKVVKVVNFFVKLVKKVVKSKFVKFDKLVNPESNQTLIPLLSVGPNGHLALSQLAWRRPLVTIPVEGFCPWGSAATLCVFLVFVSGR